jgi:hypothetical protein
LTVIDDEQQRQFEESAGQWYRWQRVAREFVIAANYPIDWYDPPREDGPKGRAAEQTSFVSTSATVRPQLP